jgi:hypothetical protein
MNLVLEIISAFFIALIVTNFTEWFGHKYIFHYFGKKKNSWFNYHWQHHNICLNNNGVDQNYVDGFFKSSIVV